jgi:CheY-like chemotaxis protein
LIDVASEKKENEGLRVLVVSDNQAVRDEFAFGFPTDVTVSFAHDSRDAWDRLREEAPSAVIVDLQTGNAGGYNLARDMAATRDLANIPVVMLLEREQDEWLARQAGAHRHHLKPVTALDVLDDLQTLPR